MIRTTRRILLLLCAALVAVSCKDKPKYLFNDPMLDVDERVDNIISLLTLEEKANFFSGIDDWHLPGVERLGIPSIKVTDGGHGVAVKDNNGTSTCYPTAVGQGATWDRDLIFRAGAALARDTRHLGSSILLGPMINLHRVPVGGRNYETYSEDPYLTGELAAALVKGIQSENTGAVIKSFTANNQQKNQEHLTAMISERALNELYFPAFRIAIEKAAPVGVMTAYNGVNGHPTSESRYLLTDVLKNELGHKGFIVSDWRATVSSNSITAGLDIEMPGPGKYMDKEHILKALSEGIIDEAEIDRRIRGFLRALVRMRLLDHNAPPAPSFSAGFNASVAREVAEGSIVLLKNENNLLPLSIASVNKIAVIGPNAMEARLGGGGSSSVTVSRSVSPYNGLKNFAGNKAELYFAEGAGIKGNMPVVPVASLSHTDNNGKTIPGLKGEYFDGWHFEGAPKTVRDDNTVDFSWGWAAPCEGVDPNRHSIRWSGSITAPESGEYKLGLSIGDAGVRMFIDGKQVMDYWGDPGNEVTEARFVNRSEYVTLHMDKGSKHDIVIEYHKKDKKNLIRLEWSVPGSPSLIDEAVKLARECDVAVVFAGISNLFEGGTNDRKELGLPGEQDKLIKAVAAANPNTVVVLIGGTPLLMPWVKSVGSILDAFYPGQEGGDAIANVLFGAVNPSGKLPDSYPVRMEDVLSMKYYPGTDSVVEYKEGIYVGYRQPRLETVFPFGHGLSYTTFGYGNMKVDAANPERCFVTIDVSNFGDRDGKEVVQIYVHDVVSSVDRPYKELKGFEKVLLRQGETRTVNIELDRRAFSFYDEATHKWVIEPGEFDVMAGSSSGDIRIVQRIKL